MSDRLLNDRHVIFEFHTMGAYVKVTAMDTKSLVEVSIQGPAATAKGILKNNALRRLKYVLVKKGIVSDDA